MLHALRSIDIKNICTDSRDASNDSVFVAIKGECANSFAFIDDAIKKGARAVVTNGPEGTSENIDGIWFFYTEDTRVVLGDLCREFYPNKPAQIIAVTGTDGKTSICNFILQLSEMLGMRASAIGTIGIKSTGAVIDREISHSMSMPDCLTMHKILSDGASYGIDLAAFEATSHGLSQGRAYGIDIGIGIFSSFSQDHLDYHNDMESYFAAKELLFTKYMETGSSAILHESVSEILRDKCIQRGIKIIEYGKSGKDASYHVINTEKYGYHIKFDIFGDEIEGFLPLVCKFQVTNVLAALTALKIYGHDIKKIDLSHVKTVSGRCEHVGSIYGADVFIDYAHTPGALENVLKELREHLSNRLILVFGCGGGRDTAKRVMMGKVAQQYADIVIVTDDNPRDEDPDEIRKEILDGCINATEISGRDKAIAHAVSILKDGDTLLVSGKGHESFQIIGNKKHEFSDKKYIQQKIGRA